MKRVADTCSGDAESTRHDCHQTPQSATGTSVPVLAASEAAESVRMRRQRHCPVLKPNQKKNCHVRYCNTSEVQLAGSAINVLGLRARARASACSSHAANGLKYSQKIYFMSLYIRFSRSDSPTPCTGTRTESLALTHTCIAEAKMARRGRPRALPTLC